MLRCQKFSSKLYWLGILLSWQHAHFSFLFWLFDFRFNSTILRETPVFRCFCSKTQKNPELIETFIPQSHPQGVIWSAADHLSADAKATSNCSSNVHITYLILWIVYLQPRRDDSAIIHCHRTEHLSRAFSSLQENSQLFPTFDLQATISWGQNGWEEIMATLVRKHGEKVWEAYYSRGGSYSWI